MTTDTWLRFGAVGLPLVGALATSAFVQHGRDREQDYHEHAHLLQAGRMAQDLRGNRHHPTVVGSCRWQLRVVKDAQSSGHQYKQSSATPVAGSRRQIIPVGYHKSRKVPLPGIRERITRIVVHSYQGGILPYDDDWLGPSCYHEVVGRQP